MLLDVVYENLKVIPIILVFIVCLIIYYIIRHFKSAKAMEYNALYDYVLKKYGKDYVGFYVDSKIKNEFKAKNLVRCEYVEFKYLDDDGFEKKCRTGVVDLLDVNWIKSQTEGVKIKVFKDLAIVDLSEEDSSNVNLAEGYTGAHFIVDVAKGLFGSLFGRIKIDERFLPYYEEFKQSDEYKKVKEYIKSTGNKKSK